MYGSQFHFFIDMFGAHIQGSSENIKAQHIVHLVGEIASAGCHDQVFTHGDPFGIGDLGIRVGQRENDRVSGHRFDHVLFDHITHAQANEYIGIFHGFGQGIIFVLLVYTKPLF